jgi:cytochrome c553
MKTKLFTLFCVLCLNLIIIAVTKQSQAAVLTPLPEKISLCSACHGEDGKSLNPQWPNLAGQNSSYLLKQLNDYKKAVTRNGSPMPAIVAALSDNDIQVFAEFYAKQILVAGTTPKSYLKKGEELYRGGDMNKHVAACIACHGPKGTGNSEAGFPLLSGQNAAYTIQQLEDFKNKKRVNDLNGIMQDIAARMSSEDIAAVAYYIQGLH